MATLILTVVGTALGGPVGGAIGAVIGQQIDQAVFAPPGRQGPRLADLSAQTSSYGKPIPKLFGTNRVAGNVIWSTDLRETASTSGGKGSPSVTTYSYSASIAVALSARAIQGIGRIWADGNLLRGAAGDWKTPLGAFRLYVGTDDQAVDPLIASSEGGGQTPAYRGTAYAVFEGLVLDTYGRRVPSLTFEVIADAGDISLAQIAESLTDAAVATVCPSIFGGYAASGDSVRGAIETLTSVVPVRVQDDGDVLWLVEQGGEPLLIDERAVGAHTIGGRAQRLGVARQSASTITQTLVLAYYDSARDYQQGMQRARRDGGMRKEDRINLPVTLQSAAAKSIVEQRLDAIWSERVTAKVQLPWRYLALRPGDNMRVPGSDDLWRVAAIRLNKMVIECDLVRTTRSVTASWIADSGRTVAQIDAPAGPTQLHLLDLPLLTDGVAAQPIVRVVAAGTSSGWRQAVLTQSADGGASWRAAGQTAARAVLGSAVTALVSGSATLIDLVNSVNVRLLNDAMQLNDASDTLLLGGANLAMLGGELLQFERAAPLGANIWRLSGLWRGRRGTEDRMAEHAVGDEFTLITPDALAALSVSAGIAELRVAAQGVGDHDPLPEVSLVTPGLSLRPLDPVALRATLQRNGDFVVSWIRRSRNGWGWADGVDAPLAEENERYSVQVSPSKGVVRTEQCTTQQWIYTAADRAADLASGAARATIGVSQVGTMQSSPVATISVSLI